MTRISGLLPIRNGAVWIPRTLHSILGNLRENDELVVVDDGSTDGSLSYIQKFSASDNRIVVLKTPGLGLVDALNMGFSIAKNPWIARFDVDDTYPSGRLEAQRALISEEIGAIFCDYRVMLNGKYNLGFIPSPLSNNATRLSLLRSQRTAHPSALINRNVFDKAGGYLSSTFPVEDLSLWTRIAKLAELRSVPFEGLHYNLHRNSVSRKNQGSIKLMHEEVIRNYLREFDLSEIHDSIDITLENYAGKGNEAERRILHLWDFLHPLSQEILGKKKSQAIKKRILIKLCSLSTTLSTSKMLSFRALRHSIR